MKTNRKLFALGALLFFAVPAMAGCSVDDGGITIKLLNCEDYIGEDAFEFTYEDAEGVEHTIACDDVLTGFEAYESEVLGRPVHVIYDTYDTNETMLSSLKTGKTTYDLIAASDYTVQKMMSLDMLQPITEQDRERIANYDEYGSKYLLDVTKGITAPISGQECTMYDYSVGYMWGTLGILFNPEKVSSEKGIDEEEVMYDMLSWSSLWDPKYKNMASVKDSMRDTYSVGVMQEFDEQIRRYMSESGCFDMDDPMLTLNEGMFDEAVQTYNPKLTEIFNSCSEEVVERVKATLLQLKENVFGFEVDSGKDDMVKGLVGMNLAWSGDAVYSMDRGENGFSNTIYYSIPSTGGNIWFDSWCIPKTSDAEHKAIALDFLNFISDPTVAAANMETIGYTSFIAGDTVHGLIRLWYDPRAYAMYQYHAIEGQDWEDSDFVYREYKVDEKGELVLDEDGEPIPVEEDKPYVYNDDDIRYQLGFDLNDPDALANLEDWDPEEGIVDMSGSTFEKAVMDGVPVEWNVYRHVYNDKAEAFNELVAQYNETHGEQIDEVELVDEWDVRNLTYMFQGTLSGVTAAMEESDDPAVNPYYFYTDELTYVPDPEAEDGEMAACVTIGRQFYAQYPDHEMIPKLAVMADYGENNTFVLKMWSDVKSNNLPLAGVVVFGVLLSVAVFGIVAYLVTKHYYHQYRVARRKAVAAMKNQGNGKPK